MSRKSQNNYNGALILISIFALGGVIFILYKIIIEPTFNWITFNINTIILIFVSLLVFTAIGGVIYWGIKYGNKQIDTDYEPDIELKCQKIIEKIKEFKPVKRYKNEESYHHTLFQALKPYFPDIHIEEHNSDSRPDITIGAIAIEVKGPTTNASLRDLGEKIKYLRHYKRLICVLFEHDYDNNTYYRVEEAMNTFKGNKVIFIPK